MAKKLKIGLVYSYNKDWVAGAYYILNLIHALNKLDHRNKPLLIILCSSKEEFTSLKDTGYPYLKFRQFNPTIYSTSYTLSERVINKISRIVGVKNLIRKEEINVDILFPAVNHPFFSTISNKLFWIPDFQEHFLPHFFSEQEITVRSNYQKELAAKATSIVFSSEDARTHFKQIYPLSKSQTFVLPFAVTHPSYTDLNFKTLSSKYSLTGPYFFCPNQFWKHKNHLVILNALKMMNEEGNTNILFVFSGKESDYRNPDYFEGIKKYVIENRLEKNVRFLGFIDRSEQLQIMNHSIAVVQPSLFEGWSTVVEDAKAMNKFIIVSDLPVHREQLINNADFFDPHNAFNLKQILTKYSHTSPTVNPMDYNSQVEKFGITFLEILKELKG